MIFKIILTFMWNSVNGLVIGDDLVTPRKRSSARASSPPSRLRESKELARGGIKVVRVEMHRSWFGLIMPVGKHKKKIFPTFANVNHNDISPDIITKMAHTYHGSPLMPEGEAVIYDSELAPDMSHLLTPYSTVSGIFIHSLRFYTRNNEL